MSGTTSLLPIGKLDQSGPSDVGPIELRETARTLASPPRGLLAVDESIAVCDQAFTSAGLESTPETRRATASRGLLPPNHYLAACVQYLLNHRSRWREEAGVGKTVVSSSRIDKVTASLGRQLYEVPVGSKFFVAGLNRGRWASPVSKAPARPSCAWMERCGPPTKTVSPPPCWPQK